MARGWESKDVEMQLEAAEQQRRQKDAAPKLTPEQLAIMREREGLELSRTRVLADLSSATHAGYRAILQRSLEFLDSKLASLAVEEESKNVGKLS